MADNISVTQGSGTTMATDDVSGVQYPRVKVSVGVDGAATDVSTSNPMPVEAASLPLPTGAATQTTLAALLAELELKADLTQTQPVSGPLTDAQLRAAAVPVSGPLTDAQLRAAAILVSASALPLPAGAATQATLAALLAELELKADLTQTQPVSGPVTDAQIRATPLPISGNVNTGLTQPLTDTELRASPVPVLGEKEVVTGVTQNTVDTNIIESTDVSDYSMMSLQILGPFTAQINFQGSNDNTNWVPVIMQRTDSANSSPASTTTNPAGYVSPVLFKYFRARITSYTDGDVTGILSLTQGSIDFPGQIQIAAAMLPNGTGGATAANQNTQTTALQILDDVVGAVGAVAPTSVQAMGLVDPDGNSIQAPSTENGALAIGNAVKKFRDGFADLPQGDPPDTLIWDVAFENQGSSSIGRAGNAQGASYMKLSLCPITPGSQISMTTKRTFKFPMRFINLLSISQRIIGQELEVSIVGVDGSDVVTQLTPKADLSILGTVSLTSNVATINFSTSHGLVNGDRVILVGNTERRLNVGPVVVTILTATSITVPLALANGTYTAGGVVRWADPLAYAKNGAGLLHENATATNATFLTRRNGFNTRLLNQTIVTTANGTNLAFSDPFNATSMNQVIANQEEFTIVPRSPDAITAPGNPMKWSQTLPDEELEFKIRVRAKNLDNLTVPIARITAISKTGTTTATVTTDVAHGLAVTDFVQIYGVRDIVSFPNLTASTVVASIVSPTQFTIIIGAALTVSSAGGTVFLNQGSVLAPGISAINVQSISRTNNVLTLIGNTNWAVGLPGETVHLYGCDATSMGLYDGAYKVLRLSTTTMDLESVGADFGSINCGGAIMRRTDLRVHGISEIEHTRLIAELSAQQGSADNGKALPVNIPGGTVINSGTVTTVSTVTTVTTVAAVTAANLALPGTIADVASAALTTTTTTAAITPTFGTAYQVNIPVTVFTATSLDINIEESTDNGTNWFVVYSFPRITATGFYNSPILRMRGTRVRYVQTFAGTTCTRAINRSQISHAASQIVQIIDRTIVPNTLNSVSPSLLIEGCQDFNASVRCTAQTTPATILIQFSADGTNWFSSAASITTAVGIVQAKIANEQWKFARLIVSAAGSGITLGEAMITGNGR